MKIKRMHYSMEAKRKLLFEILGDDLDAQKIAEILDYYSFQRLKKLATCLFLFGKGKKCI